MKRKNLVAARIKKCGSQQVLADRIPVSRVEVSHWENVHATPYPYHQERLGEILECDDISALLQIFEDEEMAQARGEDDLEKERDEELIPEALSGQEDTNEIIDEDETVEEEKHPSQETSRVQISLSVPIAIQDFIASNITTRLLQIAHTNYATPDDMTTAIQSALKDFEMTNNHAPDYEITRRKAICELASLPMIALGQNPTLHGKHYDEILRYCTAALEACWELYRGSDEIGTLHAYQCVCTYVPLLEAIAHDSSYHRKQALDLAAQYALLQTMLGWGCIGARETVIHAQNALSLSRESGNILLQLSAHSKLSWTYTQGGNYVEAYNIMQEGEHVLKCYQRRKKGPSLPIGVIGNFYSGYALTQTDNGIPPDRALGIATDSEPLKGHVALVKFTTIDQMWEAARICSAKGDPKQAMVWLEKLIDTNTFAPRQSLSERGRFGAINTLADALLQSKNRDMKHIIRAWTVAIEGAKALKSEQRYRDAMANLAVMRKLYPGERAILKLVPLTAHWDTRGAVSLRGK